MNRENFNEFEKISAPQEWIDRACQQAATPKGRNSYMKKIIALAACAAVAATGVWGYFRWQNAASSGNNSGIIEPISGQDTPKKENINNAHGGRVNEPTTDEISVTNDGKIIFADSVTLPETNTLNIFAFEQTDGAAQLKGKVETLFGIDSLESTENSVDQFFDSRGIDKNGSQITFQQNTVSGSFTYTATFSEENSKKYLESYSAINLGAMLPQLTEVAKNVAAEFASVTDELVFEKAEECESGFVIGEDYYTYKACNFKFVRKTPVTVTAADGFESQSTNDDFFLIELRPDGEVISISSYLTNAPMRISGAQEMFTLSQLSEYLEKQEQQLYEEMGHHNPTRTVVSCKIVYINDYCIGIYKPYAAVGYYFSTDPDMPLQELIPVSFIVEGY